jgi:putative hydrolase of the HAD superfamily
MLHDWCVVKPAIEGILFDIDDTLVDTWHAFGAAIGAVRREFLPHLPVETEAEMLAMWRADVNGHYRAYTGGLLSDQEQRLRRAAELHAAYGGPPVDEAFYPAWFTVFWAAFSGAWTVHDDVLPTLKVIEATGLPVGSVTNARRDLQVSKLAAAGVSGVPVLVAVDTFGVGKPDPRVFLEGCARLGTDPARTVYVGDEPDIDARAAVAAGLVGIWLDRPHHRLPAVGAVDLDGVHRITGLDALPGLLGLV